MRPTPSGESLPSVKPRSRKSSVADHLAAHSNPSSHVPTTFFLRSEDDLERSMQDTGSVELVEERGSSSTFGVQSLADTLEAAFGQADSALETRLDSESTGIGGDKGGKLHISSELPEALSREDGSTRPSPGRKHKKQTHRTLSYPLTPLNAEAQSPLPPSAMPSTPKSVSLQSLKLSDDESSMDDSASQAIASSVETDDESDNDDAAKTEQGASGSFPQLVMPSIQMPTRRPFTTKGKSMGRLKILVAGAQGVGKTSLIRSIVQQCEDIVHVDPFDPNDPIPNPTVSRASSRKSKDEPVGTTRITEIHASTKSYPHWWSELDDGKTLRRRKSTTDAILERNICFIDTPGFNKGPSNAGTGRFITDYIESLLHQDISVSSMNDTDLLAIMSGGGGVQVDLIIYLLMPSHDISKDLEFMQRLSELTNLIPVIAKSDTLSASEMVAVKTSVLAQLQTTSIKPFLFGRAIENALLDVQGLFASAPSRSSDPVGSAASPRMGQYPFSNPTFPYAISSLPGPDADNMDASALMSPDYVQPLLHSELGALVDQVFQNDSIAWLRHSAAKKLLIWKRQKKLSGLSILPQGPGFQSNNVAGSPVGLHGASSNSLGSPSLFSVTSPSGVLVPRATSPFSLSDLRSNLQSPFPASSPSLSHTIPEGEGPTGFSLTRYNHVTTGDERFADIRMAKWATDLQQSLRNERERYEETARNERARWLLERVGEEVKNGNIVTSPGGSPRAEWAVVQHGKAKDSSGMSRYGKAGHLDSRDPLGLCDFSDEVRKRGFILVKVLGGVSVLGAIMVATIKACGLEANLPEGGLWVWLRGGE
ncbi:hypothetical protein BU24DRAFT_417694 [Aaosphaeria arxii CBS 175.79]|uniref:Septin-type G domain-containing protein n=1 Tax=Aaosphaeria arxii CBS 175.79 TaxID=1450172 RepID=A0A6A5YAJ4_9PLEO|nr:uncharacterized protein BU24DRAFT_417694 [Aaosphaeria arxii CBS 175.79]KAF2022047.1 hypothetical protein BU24DRAFT_417694 [Aaosphaeria arxii CBS 175.79]